ncbi:MAG TPA: hypothetical protein VEQ35_00245 [Beijerinckia sp.]|nr:hypothetical protein [Beijerinckia sp.]
MVKNFAILASFVWMTSNTHSQERLAQLSNEPECTMEITTLNQNKGRLLSLMDESTVHNKILISLLQGDVAKNTIAEEETKLKWIYKDILGLSIEQQDRLENLRVRVCINLENYKKERSLYDIYTRIAVEGLKGLH